MRQAQRAQDGAWDFPPTGVQKNDHAGEIFRVFKNLFRMFVGCGNPPMSEDRIFEGLVRPEPPDKRVHGATEIRDHFLLFLRRRAEVDVILMWAEIALEHQFGDGNLRIDGTAKLFVSLPFEGRNVVGRCCGQGDYRRLVKLLRYGSQRFPPLGAKVMRLVENEGPKLRLYEGLR